LSKKLGVVRGTVRNRIRRLESSGLITVYAVWLSSDNISDGIRAWMCIAIEGDRTSEVVRILLGEPAISSLHDTNGRWDLLAEVRSTSIVELSAVLKRVRKIKGIETTEAPETEVEFIAHGRLQVQVPPRWAPSGARRKGEFPLALCRR
jgi:DNA-binding Lrp family transcriptional regulator